MVTSMDQASVALVQRTVNQFNPQKFYTVLFERHPELRDMFPQALELMAAQHARLAASVAGVVSRLGVPDAQRVLGLGLRALGRRHGAFYAVRPEHYPMVGAALLDAFEPALSEPELVAWRGVFEFVSGEMLAGAKEGLPPGEETLL